MLYILYIFSKSIITILFCFVFFVIHWLEKSNSLKSISKVNRVDIKIFAWFLFFSLIFLFLFFFSHFLIIFPYVFDFFFFFFFENKNLDLKDIYLVLTWIQNCLQIVYNKNIVSQKAIFFFSKRKKNDRNETYSHIHVISTKMHRM